MVEVGDVFERLTVKEYAGVDRHNKRLWRCDCSCGGQVTARTSHLLSGAIKSCGCIRRENAAAVGKRNGSLISVGETFGRWTVLEQDLTKATKRIMCRCSCGTEQLVSRNSLVSGTSKGCKRCKTHPRRSGISIGDIFGRWIIVGDAANDASGKIQWACRCSCDKHTRQIVLQQDLTRGASKSCGCIRSELLVAKNTVHGLSKYPAYRLAYTATRRARKLRAVPPWHADKTISLFASLRETAEKLLSATGERYEVDHIVPLVGKARGHTVVCGLHVDNNLQLIKASANAKKSCYSWPDMWDYSCYNELLTLQEQ